MFERLQARLYVLRRRLSPGSKVKVATKYGPGMTLSRFLLLNKRRYLDAVNAGYGRSWTVVMGNEAGGMISASDASKQ